VIVDAGGQRARTPTGREYLPFPRHNPDLWKLRVLDVLQTHNKVESGISNTIPWMTNLNPLQLEQEWRPMSFNFICLWNISVVTDVISEFRFCPNLWDGMQGHLWASQVVNLIIPALVQGHATTSFIVEVCILILVPKNDCQKTGEHYIHPMAKVLAIYTAYCENCVAFLPSATLHLSTFFQASSKKTLQQHLASLPSVVSAGFKSWVEVVSSEYCPLQLDAILHYELHYCRLEDCV
jgi:hypothetical protein